MFGILLASGCATTPPPSTEAGGPATIEGIIAAIDTQPWAYDGNAVIQVDTADRGRVAVQLPARWNLCKAAPVAVDALAVGMRVRATGSTGAEGELVVCGDAAHRLVPVEGGR
jgi:hypothetical protein